LRLTLSISLILAVFLLVGCEKREVDIIPGSLYRVTTTEGDGFIVFDRQSDDEWKGIYYLSKGQLMAEQRTVELEIGKELILVDKTGKEIPLLNYELYEEPAFQDYPETWAYRDSAYSVSKDKNVRYGNALGYWTSNTDSAENFLDIYAAKSEELSQGEKELELTMDVYLPNDKNDATRPLLVLIHGGAFFIGDKRDLGFPAWANDFASMGYVVASVNYRLGFTISTPSIKRAGFRAVQDVDAAIRYIIHNKSRYNVDPERVFVAGTSAGGITALNVAFMRDKDIPDEAQEEGGIHAVNLVLDNPYQIRAVGNMWGAVNTLSILDNAPTPVISFHSTGDNVVPFGKGHPFKNFFINWLLFPTMYGSEQISKYLGDERSDLHPYNLPDCHTLHTGKDITGKPVLNERFFEIETSMRDFFSDVMLPSPIEVKQSGNSPIFTIHSSDLDSVYWHVEGGAILKHSNHRADVLLFPDKPSHSVIVSGKYKSGLTFRNQCYGTVN